MDPKTLKRCRSLAGESKAICDSWVNQMTDDYDGKIRFCLALATAVAIMRDLVPILEGTGQDFIDSVKEGTRIWVEAGEPKDLSTPPPAI